MTHDVRLARLRAARATAGRLTAAAGLAALVAGAALVVPGTGAAQPPATARGTRPELAPVLTKQKAPAPLAGARRTKSAEAARVAARRAAEGAPATPLPPMPAARRKP